MDDITDEILIIMDELALPKIAVAKEFKILRVDPVEVVRIRNS